MLPSLEKDGVDGVKAFLQKVGSELRYMMSFTGFAAVADINDSVLHITRF
jgi:isopentenyl diphosphate isomerase/L-lactate dehydrogenase-like FMN-dependent dehydrogenase